MSNCTVTTSKAHHSTGSAVFAIEVHRAPDYDKARAGSLYLTAPA